MGPRSAVAWRKRWTAQWDDPKAIWNIDPDAAFELIDESPTLDLWDESEIPKHDGAFGGPGDVPVECANEVITIDVASVDGESSPMLRAVSMSLDAEPDDIVIPANCNQSTVAIIFCRDQVDNEPNEHDPKELNWAWYNSLDIRNRWDIGRRMRRVANWSNKSDKRFHPAAVRERYFEDHEYRLRNLEETA